MAARSFESLFEYKRKRQTTNNQVRLKATIDVEVMLLCQKDDNGLVSQPWVLPFIPSPFGKLPYD